MKTFYTTTPIYYASGRLHIGSSSTTIICDFLTRYKKAMGYDTFFLTGMDEHGQKIEKKAKEAGISPKEWTDKLADDAKDLWKYLKCDYSYFVRTTDDKHVKMVQDIFEKMKAKGDIYLGEYDGNYCVDCEAFFTNSEIGEEELCPLCHRKVSKVKEESYFFKLSAYQDKLLKFIEDNPKFIIPEGKKNEVVSFIKSGLEDLSISRCTFSWGIPIKSDPKHVVYVWLDALFNYLTSLNFLEEDHSLFDKYWNGEVVHVVAKDILRFHAIFWPIFLMSAEIPVNFQLFTHNWFLMMGDKMSKSKGNVIYPSTFVSKYGLDSFRYYILREFPYTSDTICTPKDYIIRYNSDLVNDYGNLVSRTVSMVNKYFAGHVSYSDATCEYTKALREIVDSEINAYHEELKEFKVDKALTCVSHIVQATNKLIDQMAPWALAKEGNTTLLNECLYHLLEAIRVSTILYSPVLLDSFEIVSNTLGLSDGERKLNDIHQFEVKEYNITSLTAPLFPRVNDVEADTQAIIEDMAKELAK